MPISLSPHFDKRLDSSRITTYSRISATAGAVYLPLANTEGGAAGYNRGRAPRHRKQRLKAGIWAKPISLSPHFDKRLDFSSLFCRDEATRTPVPYVPNVVRYQLRYIPSTCFF